MEISISLINALYEQETIYRISASQPKYILFLSGDQKISPDESEMLSKLLNALNIGADKFHIAPSNQVETIDSLMNLEFEFAIVSGMENTNSERNDVFYTVDLQILNKSIDEKKKLWAGLQRFKKPA